MLKKNSFFVMMLVWNILFFFLCGYWQRIDVKMDRGVGLVSGIIAVIVIALGEASVIQQLYLGKKWKDYKKQVFENRMIKQIFLLIVFHIGLVLIVSNLINVDGIFYVAILGILLSMGWMSGSDILWTSEEASYYLIGNGKIYNVENVMENTKVFELSCTRKGERDRVITIEKKEAIDEYSILK